MKSVKALFLDRDGVVNVDHGYVYQPEKFEFIDGVFSACKAFAQAGYKIIIVTNQSGIGRGYYSEADFSALTQWMIAQFAKQQVPITDVYFCPHHPSHAQAQYLQQCSCRKPKPGMLLQAVTEHNIDIQHSVMVGDKQSDMLAAQAAGVGTCILVRTGKDVSDSALQSADFVCDSIRDSVQYIA